MQTTDYEALIYLGIGHAGGHRKDIECLRPEWFVELGKRAAEAGAKKQTPRPNTEPPAYDYLPVPEDGEIFELTLDGDATDPIKMLRNDMYIDADKWKFKGPKVRGMQIGRFKMVSVGWQPTFDALTMALVALHGAPALGQWREAFKKKYARPDNKGPIGFTGSEWVNGQNIRFPYLRGQGNSWYSNFIP